jgi:hypothetical protein
MLMNCFLRNFYKRQGGYMLAGFDRALRHPSRTSSRERYSARCGYPDCVISFGKPVVASEGGSAEALPRGCIWPPARCLFITPATGHRGTLGRPVMCLNPTRKRAALGLGRLPEQNLRPWPLAPRPQTEPSGANDRKANRRKENLSKVHLQP